MGVQKERNEKRGKGYGTWLTIALRVLSPFVKKRRVEGEILKGPCVYVCRHMGDKGVVAMFASVKNTFRPWVLHVLTDYDLAKKHFQEYTFPQRMGKGKLFSAFCSPIAARVLVSLVKSAKGIPVYRGKDGMRSITTLKKSVEALQNGDCLLICPDVDYADEEIRKSGEIYRGFFAVDKLYRKKTGQSVDFVPVYMDEEKIVLHAPVRFGSLSDEETIAVITNGIYNP